ncbi:MAG: hypothetical protein IAF08_13220 [Rhizobacter sp.]|nr:hypothetical protein [Chlorobiales bacterium]
MKKIAALFLGLLFITNVIYAQGSAGSAATQEARYIFNLPSAGTLERGSYAIEGLIFSGGGVLAAMSVGISNDLTFGISYGAGNVVGSGDPVWNKLPGVMVRYRIIPEDLFFPAITLGFDSQGRGNYIDSLGRYERKSAGFFAAASKNLEFLGFLTLHGGVNYSLETRDDRDANFYVGLEKTIGPQVTIYSQYDFAFNDNSPSALGTGRGFWDAGLRWSVGSGITLELNLSNLSNNFKDIGAATRSVRLEYINTF